jgi:hypothetical protein
MVLRPLVSTATSPQEDKDELAGGPDGATKPVPAWSAIAERQRCAAQGYWLISQPDHAHLSGELAAHFVSDRFPTTSPLLARIVAVHDLGWAGFPGESGPAEPPLLTSAGRPQAFNEFAPREFLSAWTDSIAGAQEVGPAGGIIVSRHFCELGRFRLAQSERLGPDELELIRAFIAREEARQEALLGECPQSGAQLDQWLAVLQFCDLLSLYLCCGAAGEASFPPGGTDRPVRISHCHGEELYRLAPSPFQPASGERVLTMEVLASQYPANGAPQTTKLRFLLA